MTAGRRRQLGSSIASYLHVWPVFHPSSFLPSFLVSLAFEIVSSADFVPSIQFSRTSQAPPSAYQSGPNVPPQTPSTATNHPSAPSTEAMQDQSHGEVLVLLENPGDLPVDHPVLGRRGEVPFLPGPSHRGHPFGLAEVVACRVEGADVLRVRSLASVVPLRYKSRKRFKGTRSCR